MIEDIVEADRVVMEDQEVDQEALIGQGDQEGVAVMIEIVEGAEEVEAQGDRQGIVGAIALTIQKMYPLLPAGKEIGNAN